MSDERDVVDRFWELMRGNDFAAAGAVLSDDFVFEWPGTNERFRGRSGFAAVNTRYPAHGPWTFDVHRVVVGEGEAVTDTTVSDGVVVARAISFFTIVDGCITRLVEYWPSRPILRTTAAICRSRWPEPDLTARAVRPQAPVRARSVIAA